MVRIFPRIPSNLGMRSAPKSCGMTPPPGGPVQWFPAHHSATPLPPLGSPLRGYPIDGVVRGPRGIVRHPHPGRRPLRLHLRLAHPPAPKGGGGHTRSSEGFGGCWGPNGKIYIRGTMIPFGGGQLVVRSLFFSCFSDLLSVQAKKNIGGHYISCLCEG